MMAKLIAALGLSAMLMSGCAHEVTNKDLAVGAVAVVVLAGIAVADGEQTNCEIRDRCRPPDPTVSVPPSLDVASRSGAVHTVVGPGMR
jgi:hypothetical protein